MALTGVIRTGLAAVLTAIETQLVAKAVVPDIHRVLWVVRQSASVPHFGAEHDILLRPGGFTIDKGHVSSAGRMTTRIIRQITTVCRTRSHLDEANRDKAWLSNVSLGHLLFEEATADALQLFWPEDVDGNKLLCEPMRMTGMDSLTRQAQRDGAWGASEIQWEIQYVLSLDQTVQ